MLARLWIRGLLALYPRDFREEYGPGLLETFRDQWKACSTRERGRALIRTTGTMLWGALAERRAARTHDDDEVETMGKWFTEFGLAARRLKRAPAFALVAVLTVAGGVGAFGSVFAVTSGVLLEDMPFEEPDQLMWVWRDYWGVFPRGWLSGQDITKLRAFDDVFEGVVSVRGGRANMADPSGTGAVDIRTVQGSPGYLKLVGVPPLLGPGFSPATETGTFSDTFHEVVLRYDLWQTALGGDPSVIGRDVFLSGEPYRVVGVMPEWYDFRQASSLGSPLEPDAYLTGLVNLANEDVYSGSFAGLARVRPGTSNEALQAALATVSQEQDASFDNQGLRLWTTGLRDDLVAPFVRPLFAVLGAGAFLLLILGANLATLFLARASEQGSSAAVRAALGAGRSAQLRTAIAEPVLIGLGGLALGSLAAMGGTEMLKGAVAATLPRAGELGVDLPVLLAVAGGVALIVLLSSIGPVASWLSANPARGMAEGGRGGRSAGSERARSGLVVAQVALALTLVVGAGLLFRTVQSLLHQDPGFDIQNTLTFRVGVTGAGYPDGTSIRETQLALLDGLASVPGVESVGYGNSLPLSQETNQFQVTFPDFPVSDASEQGQLIDAFIVSEEFQESIGLRVLEGRGFRPGDATDPEGVIVIDDVLARRFFPDGGAVGGRAVVFGDDTVSVVGVIDQPRIYSLHEDDRGQVWFPAPRQVRSNTRFALKLAEGIPATSVLGSVREVVRSRDPGLAISEIATMEDLVRASLGSERLNLRLAGVFAGIALILSGLGLYGIVAGMVIRRRREIGLRMAMGADSARVVHSVLGHGLKLVVLGTLLGLGLSWFFGRWLASFLFGVDPLDPATLTAAAGVLIVTAIVAAWAPARRATRIAPAEALRE